MSNETIDLRVEHIKTFSLLHGELPMHLAQEMNEYVDANEKIDINDDTPKGLCKLLESSGQTFLGFYSEQLPLSAEGNSFENVPIDCDNMRVVQKTENTYTHLLDNDTDYTAKTISFTTALFLKVPEQVNADNHSIGGYTYLNWGINTRADHLSLKPKQDKFIIPKIGQFILFPSWLKYSFIPFTGEGTLRVLLAKFNVRFSV
tara:strand:- start:376 stop:984 length:609 start_codon:yes stop_codon:yes gene_type:complete